MTKTAVVTGANRGIGKEIARQLAEAGFRVVVTARDLEKAKKAALEIGPQTIPMQLDIASDQSAREFGVLLRKQIDQADVLVNNAAIMGRTPMQEFDLDEMRTVMETNFFGAMRATKAVFPLLKKSPDARIINLSSGMGALESLTGGYAAYRLSKAGLNAFTLLLANELRGSSVKVYAMCPGWVRTDMGGAGATRSVEKGAETAVWLATEPGVPSGQFYRDKKVIFW